MAQLTEEQRIVILDSLKEMNIPDAEYVAGQIECSVAFPEDALNILGMIKLAKVTVNKRDYLIYEPKGCNKCGQRPQVLIKYLGELWCAHCFSRHFPDDAHKLADYLEQGVKLVKGERK